MEALSGAAHASYRALVHHPDFLTYFGAATPVDESGATGVNVAAVVEDQSPMKMVYDPKNPLADGKGYVTMPNVNVVEEMVNMIVSQRAYEANSKVIRTADEMITQANNVIR